MLPVADNQARSLCEVVRLAERKEVKLAAMYKHCKTCALWIDDHAGRVTSADGLILAIE